MGLDDIVDYLPALKLRFTCFVGCMHALVVGFSRGGKHRRLGIVEIICGLKAQLLVECAGMSSVKVACKDMLA